MPLVKPSLPPRAASSVEPQAQQVPKFAPCPRSSFTGGHTDWFRITTPVPFPNVDICPSCYNTTFRNTSYARCISQSPPKSTDVATRCDLSDRWTRVAIYWIFSLNAPDLSLLGRVAEMHADEDGPCPNLNIEDPVAQKGGKPAVTRTWYCLWNPGTGSLIEDLTVCSSCIVRLNLIFPCLNDIFRPVANGAKLQATCDLLTAQNENEGRRGELYLDKIAETAAATLDSGHRDTRPLTAYFTKWAPIPVCLKSQQVPPGSTSYTFPTSIPGYAACPECYITHIEPLLSSASPPTILREVTPNVPPHGYTCDLYSPRLQQWLADACASYNLDTYKQRLMQRAAKMQEYNLKLEQMKLQSQQLERQARMYGVQMQSAQTMERISAIQGTTMGYGYYHRAPLDFSRSSAAMDQSHQAMLQAEMVRENMALLRREWAELYE
ncbi:hypothetical protein C7974DRAFT_301898 [Boeremia exigua]|uniref:uncharacterized protein n=1 Tax=Boeremia exigua TaxID=749465 RepID=UPI001E8DA67F|nr:uncharacterized protein C7974DRAFT_301898 [Boeremia exigua]KAH6642936.1 hypothetical protein C7974DRAFT_301898 [Boeremia exigua]